MGRSQETHNKKEVRTKKEKKRKEKAEKRMARKDQDRPSSFEEMIAYVDEDGNITNTPPEVGKKRKEKLDDIEISVPRRESGPARDPNRTGVITFFNDSKGFGFIRESESGESIFVHVNELLEDVTEGQKVSFEVVKGPKGLAATKVKKA